MTVEVTIEDSTVEVTIDDSTVEVAVESNEVSVDVSAGAAPAGSSTFDDLTDTNPSGKADNDIIIWDDDTGKYINTTISALGLLKSDGSIASTGGQLFKWHVGIGAGAIVDADIILSARETITSPDGSKFGGDIFLGLDGTGGAHKHTGMQFGVATTGSGDWGELYGAYFAPSHESSGDALKLVGAGSYTYMAGGGSAVHSRVFEATSLNVGSTIENLTSYYAADATNFFGTIDKQSGAWFEKSTKGTSNYGLVLDGDGAGSDLVLGADQDVRISFDGANLRFDGATYAASGDSAITGYMRVNINGTVRRLAIIN